MMFRNAVILVTVVALFSLVAISVAPLVKVRIDRVEGPERMFVYPEAPFAQKGPVEASLGLGKSGSAGVLQVVVKGPRTIADVMKQMELNMVSLRYWYLMSDFSVIDTAFITLKIRPDGLVEDVAVTCSNTKDKAFNAQLLNQLEMFEFPQMPVAETTDLQYPLYFKKGKIVE